MNPNTKSYLGKRGYVLIKKHFSDNVLNNLRNELTVKPYVSDDYGAPPEEFKVYTENSTKIYLPKFYGIENFGPPELDRIPHGQDINLEFNGSLRPNQIEPANVAISTCLKTGGGILSLPCAYGKTALALYILSKLGKKSLIIVHKEFLLNQWIERIQQFLPTARIGVIQQDKVDIDDKDIIIAMLQSISMKEYALDTFDSMNTVIIDESHHISSRVFSRALRKVNSKYMIGLSATPNRKDGLTKVFKWYIGDVFYSKKHIDTNIVHVERLIIKSNNEFYSKECTNYRMKPMMPKMINNICENMNRTKIIIHWIKELLEEDRKILVLSDRRAHLEDIYKLLDKENIKSVGYYVGGMKQKDLDISAKKCVILGTYAIAQEGLDIPGIDTEILSSPKSDIIQAVGRILRKKHEDKPAKIIDVVDTFSMFSSQAFKRNKLYKTRKYIIDDITVWDEFDANGEPKIEGKVRQSEGGVNKKSSGGPKNNDVFLAQFKSKPMFSS